MPPETRPPETRLADTTRSTPGQPASNRIDRRLFVADLLAKRAGAVIIPGLGSPTWDCFAAGDSPDYLYSWGGMGMAVPTALGVALAQPERRVVALTGDGEMMMGIGTLGVVADQAPANLTILVLDNERFSETGRQAGLTGNRADLCAIARGFGITTTKHVTGTSPETVDDLATFLFKDAGPALAVAKIAVTDDPWQLPIKDGAAIARRFRTSLGVETA
ncbi:MAG: thiamine pyrophosphate-dependent enzyme [Pseudomonadota bacterium]